MSFKHVRIRKRSVTQLLQDVKRGQFAIPHLQREFVWDGPKAAKLLDSILKGMPVGIVLVWETPKSHRLHLRQKYHVLPPFNPRCRSVWFLIDGQQRISVLHHVRQGSTLENARGRQIDFTKVVLALTRQEDGVKVRYRRPVDDEYVSFSRILSPYWRHELSELSQRKLKQVSECRRQVLSYRTHQMFLQAGLPEIRECFLRINTQGMKVTTADAIFTQAEALDLRDIVHEVRGQLGAGFEDIPEAPVLFAFAAVQGGTEARGRAVQLIINRLNREARSNKRKKKQLAKQWNRLGPQFGRAADYLREHFCVLSRDYLASDYILSMLALFYYENGRGPSPRQAREIRKWFWATSVGSRYSGRDFNRCVPRDLKFIRDLAQSERTRFNYRAQVESVDVRRAQYAAKTALTSAVYCMLLRRGPVYLFENGLNEIPLDRYSARINRKDRHHIFPKQVLIDADVPATSYNSVCNICLLVATENLEIGSQRPHRYFSELRRTTGSFRRKLARHLIPGDSESGIWNRDVRAGFKKFIHQRLELICRGLEAEAGMGLFRRGR